ncbi:MAG: TauD/TfdA family dioxygenase [Novosphingobium sp.]
MNPFGYEVHLAAIGDIDATGAEHLRELYRNDGLLLIRGLTLSQADQIELCRHLGPVNESPFENFLISNVEKGGHLGTRELLWHNDVPYLPAPYLGASLHALTVDPDVVGTRFASGFRAYERLPQVLKDRIAGLKALQIRERVFDRCNRLTDLQAGDLCTVHDVVRRQPGTGRPYLFVNENMTACILGLPESESRALLDELFGYFYAADNVFEHRWAVGDIVIWDNLTLQHARGLAGSGTRTLQRVTIAELGYAAQYPTDVGIYDELHNEAMLETA